MWCEEELKFLFLFWKSVYVQVLYETPENTAYRQLIKQHVNRSKFTQIVRSEWSFNVKVGIIFQKKIPKPSWKLILNVNNTRETLNKKKNWTILFIGYYYFDSYPKRCSRRYEISTWPFPLIWQTATKSIKRLETKHFSGTRYKRGNSDSYNSSLWTIQL